MVLKEIPKRFVFCLVIGILIFIIGISNPQFFDYGQAVRYAKFVQTESAPTLVPTSIVATPLPSIATAVPTLSPSQLEMAEKLWVGFVRGIGTACDQSLSGKLDTDSSFKLGCLVGVLGIGGTKVTQMLAPEMLPQLLPTPTKAPYLPNALLVDWKSHINNLLLTVNTQCVKYWRIPSDNKEWTFACSFADGSLQVFKIPMVIMEPSPYSAIECRASVTEQFSYKGFAYYSGDLMATGVKCTPVLRVVYVDVKILNISVKFYANSEGITALGINPKSWF